MCAAITPQYLATSSRAPAPQPTLTPRSDTTHPRPLTTQPPAVEAQQPPSLKNDINNLNGDGDSAYQRISGSVSADGKLRVFDVGVSAGMGGSVRVTQKGAGEDAQYVVRFDKQTDLGANASIGTDSLGKKGKAGDPAAKTGPDANLNADLGAGAVDAVEMTFKTKADAIKATEILQRLQVADAMDEAASMITKGMGPSGIALSALDKTLSGGGDNPAGNPLTPDGAPGRASKAIAGIDGADLDFLKNNATAYETSLSAKAALGGELKGDAGLFKLAGAGELSSAQSLQRRIEMPADGKEGTVSYTLQGALNANASEKLKGGFELSGLPITAGTKAQLPLAKTATAISLQYSFAEAADPTTSGGGRPVPEADGLTFKQVTITNNTEIRNQALGDPSRWDSNKLSTSLVIGDPAKLGDAASKLFQGDFNGAANAADAELSLEASQIRRSGVNASFNVGADVGVGSVGGSLGVETGADDIVSKHNVTVRGTEPEKTQPQNPVVPLIPAPKDDGKTLVVLPTPGTNLRDAPGGAPLGVTQNGSFLRHDGTRQTDAAGQDWLSVTGTDQFDKPVSGWVRADLVKSHDSARGAIDDTGRYSPSLEHQRHDTYHVEKDDNLWSLAQKNGWDPQEVVNLNRDHLLNPSLIFKGDTVYLPDTARGPVPLVPPALPQPPQANPGEDRSVPQVGSEKSGESAGPSGLSGTDTKDPMPTTPLLQTPGSSAAGKGEDVPGRPRLADILRDYQVADDDTAVKWSPSTVNDVTKGIGGFLTGLLDKAPLIDGMNERFNNLSKSAELQVPQSEADALNRLDMREQLEWGQLSQTMQNKAATAYEKPADMSQRQWENDGHADAYRHALWNAHMSKDFGSDWTRDYATAHESVAGNVPEREAMDLYNNKVGRQIADENPNASADKLDSLVREAIRKGDMLVIDRNGDLAWSDQIAIGQHGEPARP